MSVPVALRKESVDRNNGIPYSAAIRRASLSARRAWIEICYLDNIEITQAVALRKESVDRNITPLSISSMILVALRKESVDRNHLYASSGVDFAESLSARRAWIEIQKLLKKY